MFYFKHFIPIADLHFWHYQHEGMSVSLLHTAFIPEQESRQYKGKHLESNPKSCTPQWKVCEVLSLIYHIHWRSNDQCKSHKLSRRTSKLPQGDAFCSKAGKGLGTKLKRELNMPIPIWDAWQQLCCDVKGDRVSFNNVFFFFFLIKLYSFKAMQTTLRR